jgi:hypothetical protein
MFVLGIQVARTYVFPPAEAFIQGECDLDKGRCDWPEQAIHFKIASDRITAMAILLVQLHAPQLNTDEVTLQLMGKEMYMGQVNVTLSKTSDGEYQGEMLLPACAAQAMTWVGQIHIKDNPTYQLTFRMTR